MSCHCLQDYNILVSFYMLNLLWSNKHILLWHTLLICTLGSFTSTLRLLFWFPDSTWNHKITFLCGWDWFLKNRSNKSRFFSCFCCIILFPAVLLPPIKPRLYPFVVSDSVKVKLSYTRKKKGSSWFLLLKKECYNFIYCAYLFWYSTWNSWMQKLFPQRHYSTDRTWWPKPFLQVCASAILIIHNCFSYEAWVIYNFLSLCLAWVGGPGAVVLSLSGRSLKPSWYLMTCCFPSIPLDGSVLWDSFSLLMIFEVYAT